MTLEELEILTGDDARALVRENIGRDPLQVALDKNIPHAPLIASQVKYLQKAKAKLPSYYDAGCVIPSLAFEQSSGELAAANKDYLGEVCVDLTCGLGVDSFYLSKKFKKVISIERDPVLAEIAKVNFKLLGADNIEVVNSSAEEFVAENKGLRVDLVYADPDRRGENGRKLVTLADCSPDMEALLPSLEAMSPVIVVKLSPMFDVHEAFRLFGENVRVEVVSQCGECKEVVVEKNKALEAPLVRSSALGLGMVEYPYVKAGSGNILEGCDSPEAFNWLIVPDISLAKAGNAVRYYTREGIHIVSDNSFAFAIEIPEKPFGKIYRIDSVYPYSPKKLKKEFKSLGIKRLNILKKDFPMKAPDIAKILSVGEGGEKFAAFTTFAGERWCVLVSQSSKL